MGKKHTKSHEKMRYMIILDQNIILFFNVTGSGERFLSILSVME